MIRYYLLFAFALFLSVKNSFSQLDTLNKLNSKGKKTGYWKVFLDDKVNPTSNIENSYFYGFELWDEGENVFHYSKNRWKNNKMTFDGTLPEKGKPILITGTFKWFDTKGLFSEEVYKNGNPVYIRSYTGSTSITDTVVHLFEDLDFTKKYNNINGTYFYQEHSHNTGDVKKYWFRKGKKKWKMHKVDELEDDSLAKKAILYLHSWKNPKKIDKITNDIYLNVELIESDSINRRTPTSYTGLLMYVRPDEFVMTIRTESIKEKKVNGTEITTSNSYSFPDSLKKVTDGELRIIRMNNVSSISHFTEKRISNFGGAIAAFSAFAALVVAPLVSVNYKTGDFNQKRYYPVLASCGIGFAIGIPLNIIFRNNKFYNIKSYSPDISDNEYWNLQHK